MNHIEEFTKGIALEAQALEDIFAQERHNHFNSGALIGKNSWYSVALESSDTEEQKDDDNKKGIVRRMIDALIGFIKKVIEKIKALFGGKVGNKEEAKQEEKVFHEYEGPGDDTLGEALRAYARQHAETMSSMQEQTAKWQKENEEAEAKRKKDQEEFDKKIKESQESLRRLREGVRKDTATAHAVNDILDKALNGAVEATDKPIGPAEMTEIVEEHVADKFIKAMASYELHFFLAMFESEFEKNYTQLIKHAGNIVKQPAEVSHIEHNVEAAEEMIECYGKCMEVVESKKRFGEEEWRKIFGDFLMRKGFAEVSFIYFFPTMDVISDVLKYNEAISSMLTKMRNEVTDETKDQVEIVRKSALAMLHATNLGSRVKKVTTEVSTILEKIGS